MAYIGKYLGEEIVDIHKTEFSMYTKKDWVMIWIEMYGQIDGSHHKQWLIDQIARILKGTNVLVTIAKWENYREYRYNLSEASEEYYEWVETMKSGEDGKDTYSYDSGIAP